MHCPLKNIVYYTALSSTFSEIKFWAWLRKDELASSFGQMLIQSTLVKDM